MKALFTITLITLIFISCSSNDSDVTAILESGNYALISEVPNALSKNMLKVFVVSD